MTQCFTRNQTTNTRDARDLFDFQTTEVHNSSMHFWSQDYQALSPDHVYTSSVSPTGHETIIL